MQNMLDDLIVVKRGVCILAAAGVVSQMLSFLQSYAQTVILDAHMVTTIIIIIAIDTVLGIAIAIKRRNISAGGFGKVLPKLLVYMCLLTAVHLASTGYHTAFLANLDSYVYSIVACRELLSIFEKSAILGVINIPENISSRFEIFKDIMDKRQEVK